MSQCAGFTKTGGRCSRVVKENQQFCWQHGPVNVIDVDYTTAPLEPTVKISGKRQIGNFTVFDSTNPQLWEAEYQRIMNRKYAKGSRSFSTEIVGNSWSGEGKPHIFLVPRVRGGPSYKSIPLQGVTSDDVVYCPISKGFFDARCFKLHTGSNCGRGLMFS